MSVIEVDLPEECSRGRVLLFDLDQIQEDLLAGPCVLFMWRPPEQ